MGNLMYLMILIIPIVMIFIYVKKRKDKKADPDTYRKRREGDEVWKTVKDHIRKTDGKGKEVIDSFVAKRPSFDYIDKTLPKEEQLKRKEEIKKVREDEKLRRKECRKNKKKYVPIDSRSLYVVLYTTRNAKTLKEDKPRAIECEVIHSKVDPKDKQTRREIIVTRELNYKKEAQWILPIKQKEEEKFQKEYEKQLRLSAKAKEKAAKKKQKKLEKHPEKQENFIIQEPNVIQETVILTPIKETPKQEPKKKSIGKKPVKKVSPKKTTTKAVVKKEEPKKVEKKQPFKEEEKQIPVKKPEPKKEEKKVINGIEVGKKHIAMKEADISDYDYTKRLKQWKKNAGYSEKEITCTTCKEHKHTSILTDLNKYICYLCFIKKENYKPNKKHAKK